MKTLLNRALGLSVLLVAVCILAAGGAYALPSVANDQQTSGKVYDWKGLYQNNVMSSITNFGQLSQVQGGSTAFTLWPAPARDADNNPMAPLMNYVFGWGLWVGGKVQTTRSMPGITMDTLVTQGYNPSNSKYEYTPGAVVNGVPVSPTSSAAKIYSSLAPGWADKDGNDTVRSVEDTWCQYNDFNISNHLTGRPLKIQVTQITYQWNYPTNTDIIFFTFKVKNAGPDTIFDAYLAPTTDCDIGGEADPSPNDVCYWDSTTNMGYQYNSTNSEEGWNRQPGCVGFMFLESPIANQPILSPNGDFSRNVGDTIGLFAFKVFNRNIDPPTDIEQYQEMAGYDYQTGIYRRLDPKPAPSDQRFMESTGPIKLAPGAEAQTIVAMILADFNHAAYAALQPDSVSIAALRAKAKTAKLIYENGWLLPGPPKAPGLTLVAGNKKALISWDKSSWAMPDDSLQAFDAGLKYYRLVVAKDTLDASKFDPNYRKYSFEGYKLYKSLDGSAWQLVAQWDKSNRYKVTPQGLEITGPDTLFTGLTNYYQYNPVYIANNVTTVMANEQGIDPAFATNADNAGLSYSYEDNSLTNGNTYYYSVTAYGINFNSIKFTDSLNVTSIIDKTPQYFETSINSNSKPVIPRTDPADYVPSSWMITANRGLSYNKSLFVVPTLDAPKKVIAASYKQVFGPVTRGVRGSNNWYIPNISYKVLDANDSTILPLTTVSLTYDSVLGWIKPAFLYSPTDNFITVNNQVANVYPVSFGVSKVEPWYRGTDTAYCLVNPTPDWRWAFRTSVLKITWHVIRGGGDTLVSNDTLSCEVWDETNNVQIQSDTLALDNITTSGWNFGATAGGAGRTIMNATSSNSRKWMNVCGLKLFFNNPTRTAVGLNMTWATHPAEGEVWRIYPFGVTVPSEGEYQVISVSSFSWATTVDWARVKVVPNPYMVRNAWEKSNERSKLQFINLPAKCTIKIFTIAGNLIKVIEHENDSQETQGGTAWWDPMLTMNNQNIASGVYIYHINSPGIGTHVGKFAVIK